MEDLDALDGTDIDLVDIGVVLAEPESESAVLAHWSEQLAQYVHGQGSLDALRLRPEPEPPWPQRDNAMLCYLIDRAAELAENEGTEAAIEWLAVHAWFEGTIAERNRLARVLIDDC